MSFPQNPKNMPSSRPAVSRPLLKKDLLRQQEEAQAAGVSADEPSLSSPGAAVAGGAPGQQVYRPVIKKRDPDAVDVRTDRPVEEQPEEATEKIVKGSPPWMASAIFHIVILLVLAACIFTVQFQRERELVIEVEIEEEIFAEDEGVQTEIESAEDDTDEIMETDSAYEDNPVEDPLAAPIDPLTVSDVATTQSMVVENAVPARRFLDGRNPGGRKGLCGKYGGTRATEDSVDLALKWLRRQQLKSGAWSLIGPYSSGAENENQESATAMALLAFQGAGHTHKKGEYSVNIARGWSWLLKQQDPRTGSFFTDGNYSHRFYTHGQCTIAICELYAMEKDKKFLEPAKKAVEYLLNSQSPEGGWKYNVGEDADMSVTGWCVMALQSARMADMKVPQESLDRITMYMDKIAQRDGARYPYQRNESPTEVMTAEAILCRQYLGWKQNDPRMEDALDYVLKRPISYEKGRDVYYWYYATQAMHHKEGRWWKQWNEVMREIVPRQQIKAGKEAGSWDPIRPSTDTWMSDGGRLYVTCLSTYMLEVYYRHLPIYANLFGADGLPIPHDGTVELSVQAAAAVQSETESSTDEKEGEEAAGGQNEDEDAEEEA